MRLSMIGPMTRMVFSIQSTKHRHAQGRSVKFRVHHTSSPPRIHAFHAVSLSGVNSRVAVAFTFRCR